MICPHCNSKKVQSRGSRIRNSGIKVREFSCKECKKWFTIHLNQPQVPEDIEPGQVLELSYDKPIKLHCATDVHHGAVEHHYEKFDDFIAEVDADPNARWFMNGDNIELIPPNYKISQRGQDMEPDDQHITFMKRIEKIADKLVFIRGGNHDMIRSINLLGVDISRVMADSLKVPYFKMPGYTQISINGVNWNLVSGHGKGGGKNGDLELDKMAAIYTDGDVFMLGHNHQLYAKPVDSLKIEDGEERLRRRW